MYRQWLLAVEAANSLEVLCLQRVWAPVGRDSAFIVITLHLYAVSGLHTHTHTCTRTRTRTRTRARTRTHTHTRTHAHTHTHHTHTHTHLKDRNEPGIFLTTTAEIEGFNLPIGKHSHVLPWERHRLQTDVVSYHKGTNEVHVHNKMISVDTW